MCSRSSFLEREHGVQPTAGVIDIVTDHSNTVLNPSEDALLSKMKQQIYFLFIFVISEK